jgi:hypothetical protein
VIGRRQAPAGRVRRTGHEPRRDREPGDRRAPPGRQAGRGRLVGTDLSTDGSTILGATGGYEPQTRHDVVAIPYGGRAMTVLARNALEPDWNR